jgi:ElaB/YqjD/DUF883 family membrane-anchored ribosome-binding protein
MNDNMKNNAANNIEDNKQQHSSVLQEAALKAENFYQKSKDKAEDIYDHSKDKAEDMYNQVKDSMHKMYENGKDEVENVQESLEYYSGLLERKIKQKPISSMVIASLIGIGLATLFKCNKE